MGYRRMKKRAMWEIYRRWKNGQVISHIAAGERCDRKTIRQYVEGFVQLGLKPEAPAMSDRLQAAISSFPIVMNCER
jgi:hypothetical protein